MALMPKDQPGQLKVASGILAIVGAVVFFMYVYQPMAEELDAKRTRVESLTSANQRVKKELARGSAEQLRQQAQAYAQNLEVMRQLVPTGNEVPALLEILGRKGRAAVLPRLLEPDARHLAARVDESAGAGFAAQEGGVERAEPLGRCGVEPRLELGQP